MTEIPYRTILGLNQQTYQRLKVALSLKLRRQVFIAVCDDLPLRDRLAAQLQADLSKTSSKTISAAQNLAQSASPERTYPRIVSLHLDLNDPSPIGQIAQWLQQFPPPRQGSWRAPLPVFQILGTEKLTRQPASVQRIFLTHLQGVERNLRWVESGVILWLTQPWFQTLPESMPEFWECRTGVFEFTGDPTPLAAILPERISIAQSSGLPLTKPLQDEARSEAERESSKNQTGNSKEQDSKTAVPELAEFINPWLSLAQDLSQLYEAEETPALSSGEPGAKTAVLPAVVLPTEDVTADSIASESTPSNSIASQFSEETAAPVITVSDTTAPASVEQTLIANLLERPWQSEELLQQIETYQRQSVSPAVMATAYRLLGNLYCDQIDQGLESVELYQQAIDAYQQCLIWLPEASLLWVDVLNDLGNLYWMLGRLMQRQGPATVQQYLEQSVQTYHLALDRVRLPEQEANYAMVQSNLGTAYGDLARYGNTASLLQQSIKAYEEALRYRPAESDPLRYASTQNNLGTTYWNLAQHQQPLDNLKRSIAAYTEALHYYDPAQDPLNFAMIQNNLGTAFWNLAQYEHPRDWLLLAVSAYRIALKYRTPSTAPAAFAATQNNLGTAFWHLANHTDPPADRMEYLQAAIGAYQTALEAIEQLSQKFGQQPGVISFDVAATHNNQGLAHYQLATDLQLGLATADQLSHLEQALHHHLQALQRWKQQSDLRQTAVTCILQTLRACYSQLGLEGQNQALSKIPASLLPEILPRL
ncbi:tetratricopeptide repeat protein [Leptolyngbya sp. FACHB-711]|uniref:tetratricopeptide repeat protein n=1 Tax=unclassified Leptolyngbya TaxID=2650499 RepID=UPI0016848BF8|nr:tetratricopeptide repeat protein [Leptolyngbya sp. FACHB-711]MBD1850098.1 tetratricopeptide repeat protein [Cyanobacteria bacterium FACHB-502]MBD2027743.1 tetratricopeptide repeat protein [Leptolyngbya sp. FACHB-711]